MKLNFSVASGFPSLTVFTITTKINNYKLIWCSMLVTSNFSTRTLFLSVFITVHVPSCTFNVSIVILTFSFFYNILEDTYLINCITGRNYLFSASVLIEIVVLFALFVCNTSVSR